MRVREQTIQLNGWAVENDPDSVITYRIEDEAGNPVDAKIVPTRRDDVSQIYYKKIIDRDLGFDIRFPYEHGKIYYLVICGEKKTTRVKYSDMMIRKKTGAANRKVQKLMNPVSYTHLVLSGQVRYDTTAHSTGLGIRAMGDQEFEITKAIDCMTKYSEMVLDPMRIRSVSYTHLFPASASFFLNI